MASARSVFDEFPNNAIWLIHLNDFDRRRMHQYIEEHHPGLGHIDLRCRCVVAKECRAYGTCIVCDYTDIYIERYRHVESNLFITVECPKCGCENTFGCRDDNDDVRLVWTNTAIVIGYSLKKFTRKTRTNFRDNSHAVAAKILQHKNVYELPVPTHCDTKQHIAEHIDENLP